MPDGSDSRLSSAVARGKTSGRSIGGKIRKYPGRSAAIAAGAIGGYGMLRGRRGSGTGSRVPGAQKGIRNY